MERIEMVGLDIAKSVFQVHGIDAEGEVVLRRRLRRLQVLRFFEKLEPCRIGIEACATAHHWARELGAIGHDVKLIPQQSILVLHRTRALLMRQRIQLSNAIRGHMAEFGIVAPIGRNGLHNLIEIFNDEADERVPHTARTCLQMLATQLHMVNVQALETERRIRSDARATELGRRLMEVPGVGPILTSALIATVPDPHAFRSGRNLAAWIGLVPRQNSSGGKDRLGGITKRGDRYLRQMLVIGALAVIRYAQRHGTHRPWLVQLMARRPAKLAAVALANKTARVVWAIMTSGERYREPVLQAA